MLPIADNPDAPAAPQRRCPLCGSEMRIADRSAYTVSYTCWPCRVTVQYPAEPLPDPR